MAKKSSRAEQPIRRFTAMLPVRLTQDELLERGQGMAYQRQLSAEHELKVQETKKLLKDHGDRIDAEAGRLAQIIRGKQEHREVEVEVRLTKKAGYCEEVRLDTGEVIETRKLSDEEMQTGLFEPYDPIPAPAELEA